MASSISFLSRGIPDTLLQDLPKSSRGRASTVKDGCCLDANILYYAIHFGYFDDPRIQRLVEFLVGYHSMEDGGWGCRAYPINPDGVFPVNCYMGAAKVLRSLASIPEGRRTSLVKSVIDREVENILQNKVYKYLKNPDGTRKDKAGWKRFGFPLFYQSDALEVLDTLTRRRREMMAETGLSWNEIYNALYRCWILGLVLWTK